MNSSPQYLKNLMLRKSAGQYKPCKRHTFGMLIGENWYKLTAKPEIIDESDPVKRLDVSILQDNLLSPILDIDDPKTNRRIDFIGGIRGLNELEKRCKEDMHLAFAMYPTSIGDLMSIADADLLCRQNQLGLNLSFFREFLFII